jgi:transcriptional regulator with XRE-family HTH domain
MFEKARFEVRIRNWRGSEFKQSAAVRDLAEATGLHRNTINNLEVGRYAGDPATLQKIEKVLVAAGVEFIDENGGGPGVRLRKRQRLKKPK